METIAAIITASMLLVPQSALEPKNSWLEKAYRAGCHLNHSGVWASRSPLGDTAPDGSDYTYLLKPGQISACVMKERG